MRRLTFEEMAFSRASDAWCPVTGRSYGPNTPRVVPNKIIKSLGDIPTYYKFSPSQGFTRYSNEVGCYDRPGEQTHVFTDELDALETRVSAILPTLVRAPYGLGLSEEGRPLEYFSSKTITASDEVFLVTTMIHGNETDGSLGTLKAFEVLCTHPDFASLRSQYAIVFLTCCNPDGCYYGQRNLAILGPHPSGVPTGINLNRVWPWFWTEFIPTSGESKGDAPITCSKESQAMYDFLNMLPGGNPIKVAWALDQHATAGDGARYVSRDRNFRDLSEEEYEKVWADWNTFRLLRAIQAKRVHDDAMPDLWVNFYRSRWRPHWHSYLGTRSLDDNGGIQAVSLVGEHNKVPAQVILTNKETYQSACNYNFDHPIAMALIAQGGVTEKKTAVLVEHETGVNLVQNSGFEKWQPTEYRPGYWSGNRVVVSETSRSEQHMSSVGRPLEMTSDLLMEMETGYTDDFGGSDIVLLDGSTTSAVLSARVDDGINPNRLAVYSWDLQTDPVLLFSDTTAALANHQFRLGKCTSTSVAMLGLGNYDTSDNLIFREYALSGTWSPTDHVTHTSPLVDAAVAYDNSGNIYVAGGRISAGSSSAKIYKASCAAWTFVEVGSDLLTSGDYGMGSCWCSGGSLDGKVALVGGTDAGLSGLVIRVFDPVAPSVSSYTVSVPATCSDSLAYSGVWYDGVDSIYVYGGEDLNTGDVYYNTIKITWGGASFSASEISLSSGLSDDDNPEDYSGEEDWIRPFRHWRALGIQEIDTLVSVVILFGGLERLPDGTDEADLDNRRSFWAHYIDDATMSRPSAYDYGYFRYNTHFDVVGFSKLVSSWSYKAGPSASSVASSDYARVVNSTGDSSSGLISLRSARTYYLHPPKWWWREHSAINLSMAKPSVVEDEVRTYIRSYRHDQTILADAPMLQTGTLWPSSWSPYGMTRAVEEASWDNVADNRWFRISFDWLPAASFLNLTNGTQKLLSIGDIVGTQYIEITAGCVDGETREFNKGNVIGPVDPYIELKVKDGVSTLVTLSIPVYWGGFLKDTAMGRFESPMTIEIWRHSQHGTGMVLRNGWAKAWVNDSTKFDPTSWSSTCNIIIHGGGWWCEPELLDFDNAWKDYASSEFVNGALLVGDRDPTYGQVSKVNCFRYIETFTRADDPNLGSEWDIITQTGNGWDISSNQARCEQLGIERWDAYPYIRDCSIIASVSAPNGNKVGLCTRLNWGVGSEGFVHGFVGYLSCTGASSADLVIERYYWNAGVQANTVLNTQAITYTAGSTVTLTLSANDDEITLTASDGATGTVTTTNSNHAYPGAFGIFGETTGAGSYVYIDSISADPINTPISITE